jgi:CheY-like chemotaxis protein
LLLENDEADVFLFRRTLGAIGFMGQVRVVESVTEARDYMQGNGKYVDRQYYPLPDLIVIDFRLSGETGLDFLRWLQLHPTFSKTPFAVLSGSMRPVDLETAREFGVQTFYQKSAEFSEMREELLLLLNTIPQVFPTEPRL